MKITKRQLKNLIRKQTKRGLNEGDDPVSPPGSLGRSATSNSSPDRRAPEAPSQTPEQKVIEKREDLLEKALEATNNTITQFRNAVDALERLGTTRSDNVDIREIEVQLQSLRDDLNRGSMAEQKNIKSLIIKELKSRLK